MAYDPSSITCYYPIHAPKSKSIDWTTTDLPPGGLQFEITIDGELMVCKVDGTYAKVDVPYRNITMTDGEYTVVLTFSGGRVIGYQTEESWQMSEDKISVELSLKELQKITDMTIAAHAIQSAVEALEDHVQGEGCDISVVINALDVCTAFLKSASLKIPAVASLQAAVEGSKKDA